MSNPEVLWKTKEKLPHVASKPVGQETHSDTCKYISRCGIHLNASLSAAWSRKSTFDGVFKHSKTGTVNLIRLVNILPQVELSKVGFLELKAKFLLKSEQVSRFFSLAVNADLCLFHWNYFLPKK